MSAVDLIDLVYVTYAIGVIIFMAFLANLIRTYGLRTLIGLFIPSVAKAK